MTKGERRPARPGGAGARRTVAPASRAYSPAGATSQTCMFVSIPAEAMCLPSGLKATFPTSRVCPVGVRTRAPEVVSQSLTALSRPAEASRLPRGSKAALLTGPLRPVRTEQPQASRPRCRPRRQPLRRHLQGVAGLSTTQSRPHMKRRPTDCSLVRATSTRSLAGPFFSSTSPRSMGPVLTTASA
jgi:hypothetical protein